MKIVQRICDYLAKKWHPLGIDLALFLFQNAHI